ncbi:hypothetical protein OHV05_24690 [Kitasatospora sp. NBC_00070]|uniref:hypothetical protein n=1 Tax=Kitasatospora sp. NBC_00070 TaxID=2975962 RepID=UPI003247EE95
MTRDQRLSILGPAGMAIARLDAAADEPPSPEQIEQLRRVFAASGRKSPMPKAA